MPYIVVKSNHQETDRRKLEEMLVVGRAPECNLVVRDIALSRRHCRIEPAGDGWAIVDLGSKNGTSVNGQRLTGQAQVLHDHDTVRLGHSKMVFYESVPEEDGSQGFWSPPRPADPHEALVGTVTGFTLLPPGQTEPCQDLPLPQPEPRVPPSLEGQDLQELLTAIASSSWDSIYASARQPARPSPSGGQDEPRRRVNRPRSPIDLSLQARPTVGETSGPPDEALAIPDTPAAAPSRPVRLPRSRRRPRLSRLFRAARGPSRWNRTAITVSLITMALLGRYCYFLANTSPSASMASQVAMPGVMLPATVKPAAATQPQFDPVYFDMPPLEQKLPYLLDMPLPHEPGIQLSEVDTTS